jgi:nitrite reductase/ring-hydroxylating ferredoxin subunit
MSDSYARPSTAPDGRPTSEQPLWRQEFPIDWPQHHHVSRRGFTRFLLLTSLPFAAAQLWLAVRNSWRHLRAQPPVRQLARLEEVPVGTTLAFHYPDEHDPCLLYRPDEQTLLAFSQKCTHLGCAVTPEPEHGCFACPCHRGIFDLTSGRPTAGPARRPLPRITLETRKGVIYATGMEVTST